MIKILLALVTLGGIGVEWQVRALEEQGACIVKGKGSRCLDAYENARTSVVSACQSVPPECKGRGDSGGYVWTYKPVYKYVELLTEDRAADMCSVEIAYAKTCEAVVRCKYPPNCPF